MDLLPYDILLARIDRAILACKHAQNTFYLNPVWNAERRINDMVDTIVTLNALRETIVDLQESVKFVSELEF